MIRAVPFEYFLNGRDDHMAFLDTVTDQFLKFNGTHCWGTWYELIDDMRVDGIDTELTTRLRSLCPVWFQDGHAERDHDR